MRTKYTMHILRYADKALVFYDASEAFCYQYENPAVSHSRIEYSHKLDIAAHFNRLGYTTLKVRKTSKLGKAGVSYIARRGVK